MRKFSKLLISIALLLAWGGGALADLVARNGSDSARITQGPCSPAVLKVIPEGHRGFFRAAFVVVDGKEHVACWAFLQDGMVMLVYADGDSGRIPAAAFEVAPGT